MPPRDPSKVQLDFPQLIADIIAQLQLTGQVGVLDFVPVVTPVYLIGQRDAVTLSENPEFASTEIVDGIVETPLANTLIVDTGALAAGTYDIWANLVATGATTAGQGRITLQHRNAANNATLATMLAIGRSNADHTLAVQLPAMRYTIGLNERLRVMSPAANWSGNINAEIYTHLVPPP